MEKIVKNNKINTDMIDNQLKNIETNDGWQSMLVGLGGKLDKSKSVDIAPTRWLTDIELSEMYAGSDGLATKIIDCVAEDMIREWINLKDPDDDTEEEDKEDNSKIINVLTRIKSKRNMQSAIQWQRLFGGCIIIIGAMDGRELDQPLNENSIKSIEYLIPIDRTYIQLALSEFNEDPLSSNFGRIEKYYVQMQVSPTKWIYTYIHYTRVLEFFGKPVPKRIETLTLDLRYWGSSIIQSIYDQLRDTGGVMQSVVNILYEYILKIFNFDGLSQQMMGGKEKEVIRRIEIVSQYMSTLNAVFLGKDEKFERNTAQLTGIADVIDRFMMWLSAVCKIPVTRLFGRSPAGMNATGESDEKIYYNGIAAKQVTDLQPQLQKLIDLICMSKECNIKNPPIVEFNSLFQLSDLEMAQLEKTKAETEKIESETYKNYYDMGVIDEFTIAEEKGWETPPEPEEEEFIPPENEISEESNNTEEEQIDVPQIDTKKDHWWRKKFKK